VRIGVTGAGGFVGSALIERLAARHVPGAATAATVVAVDARLPETMPAGVVRAEGDLADLPFLDSLFETPFDAFIHLAAVPGGAAEADYPLGWRVNVDATVAILDRLAGQPAPARLVFASSIAVFGAPLPVDRVDDETLPLPSMSYGAQKLMMEALIADHARRGKIDGLALRLPGIIARPRVKGGHLSAYMSDILHAVRAGEEFVCPVSEDATSWFMSRGRCVDNLIHALTLGLQSIGSRRAFQPSCASPVDAGGRERCSRTLRTADPIPGHLRTERALAGSLRVLSSAPYPDRRPVGVQKRRDRDGADCQSTRPSVIG
jgi:nucleoside-diphosphate-sugar epimerase